MKITKQINGNKAVVFLEGWLDAQSSPLLGEELEKMGEEVTSLILDLAQLEYISSAGLRQVVAASKRWGEGFQLRHLSSSIRYVFSMSGLEKRIRIVDEG